jgi:murein peptide amidase A
MRKLGRNQGSYCGETIAISTILREIEETAQATGWRDEPFFQSGPFLLRVFHKPAEPPAKRGYISTGIHGDEPAGPLALLQLLRQNRWPENLEIWLCPCLNPSGFELSRRENARGIDLNRDYRHLQSEEIQAHVRSLEKLPPFSLSLLLHEDWEANGFYLYELNPDNQPSLAEAIIQSVSQVCPIEHSDKVDNWNARDGIIRPDVPPLERPQWPEALYLLTHKTRLSYTLETPSDFPLEIRARAQVAAVEAALQLHANG